MEMLVARTNDFEVTGRGDDAAWDQADWQVLQRVESGPAQYSSRLKVLYSDSGIYFLFDCQDRILTATMTKDYDDIYNEDVVEVFLWPDESQPLYFEYELSPLNVELPIIVPNNKMAYFGWQPWHYEGSRRVRHGASVSGGKQEPLASIESWRAEFCIPFDLLKGMGNIPPMPGMKWRANMYRIDYDDGANTQWAWCPDTGGKFHNYWQFGTIAFA